MSAPHDDYQTTVAKLWSRLGLATPRFVEPGRVQLRVEGLSLDLFDTGRGSLAIEGVVGTLSLDATVRARQARRVLETNLGLLLFNEAGVYFVVAGDGDTTVCARASYAYATDSIDRLVSRIEDVVETIEFHAPDMKSGVSSGGHGPARLPDVPESAVIFRL